MMEESENLIYYLHLSSYLFDQVTLKMNPLNPFMADILEMLV